jgi:hypothetical protein
LIREQLTISDVVLIVFCLFMMGFSWVKLHTQNSSATELCIYKDDVLLGTYSLAEPRTIHIDEHNTVVIADGKARMAFSDCPDKRCVKQGAASNLPIICLPNRVVLEFRTAKAEKRLILQ